MARRVLRLPAGAQVGGYLRVRGVLVRARRKLRAVVLVERLVGAVAKGVVGGLAARAQPRGLARGEHLGLRSAVEWEGGGAGLVRSGGARANELTETHEEAAGAPPLGRTTGPALGATGGSHAFSGVMQGQSVAPAAWQLRRGGGAGV